MIKMGLIDYFRLATRTIISHPKLREGHVFKPRVYPSAIRVQKKERRKMRGQAPSMQKLRTRTFLKERKRRPGVTPRTIVPDVVGDLATYPVGVLGALGALLGGKRPRP